MGGELVGSSTSQEQKGSETTTLFTKIFEKYFPFYLSIGMSYDQYWKGDVWLAKHYYLAYKQKMEREQMFRNQNAWLQGLYFYEALLDVSPIMHAFAPKGTKPLPYRDKPIPITQEEIENDEQEKRNERLGKLKDLLAKSVKQQEV